MNVRKRRNIGSHPRFRLPLDPAPGVRQSKLSIAPRPRHVYMEFALDPSTLREVEALARAAGCDPFEICVRLLRERLHGSDQ